MTDQTSAATPGLAANPQRGEVTLPIGGKDYLLKVGTNELAKIEDATKEPVFTLITRLNTGRYSVKDVRILLWAAFQRHHPMSLDQVGDLIDEAGGLAGLNQLITSLIQTTDVDDEDKQAAQEGGVTEADPPDAQGGTGDRSISTPAEPA